MAVKRIPQEAQANAIPLNRAGGESYDQGQQMTMAEAMRIAAEYGHVPARISSGPMGDDTMGVYGVPTENGWVPLDQLTASDAWSRGPAGSTSMSDEVRSRAANPDQAYGGRFGNGQGQYQQPSAATGYMGQAPQQAQVAGPKYAEAYYGWNGQTPPSAVGSASSMPPQPSTTGPVVAGQQPRYNFPPNATGQPYQPPRYEFPQNATGQPYQQPPSPASPSVNINIAPSSNQQGGYDQSGWYSPSQQFETGPRQDFIQQQINRPPQPGGPQPYEQGIGQRFPGPDQNPYGGQQWGPLNFLSNLAGPSLANAMGAPSPEQQMGPPLLRQPRYQFPQGATGRPYQPPQPYQPQTGPYASPPIQATPMIGGSPTVPYLGR